MEENLKKLTNNCNVCDSDKIRYETVTYRNPVIQLIAGKTVISSRYQDIEYKICVKCGDRRTNFFTY